MSNQIKFSVGNVLRGYKSVEISVDGAQVEYKILRNGLKSVDKNLTVHKEYDAEEFDALNIFAWEKNYVGDKKPDAEQWTLTFTDGDKIYRGRGTNAYPDTWDDFLDWLDKIIPEMDLVDGKRLENVAFRLLRDDEIFEELTINRGDNLLTLEKNSSTHTYHLSIEETKNFLDVCQKYFETLEANDGEDYVTKISVNLQRHDGSAENFVMAYNDFSMPSVVKFAEEIHAFADDLSAEIFSPEALHVTNEVERIILCKVQFKGNYKPYTYRAEDETLAVGEIVDVPVGRNNDVTQAKIVDIGYFDEDEISIPLDRIKTIIGKHDGNAWENF